MRPSCMNETEILALGVALVVLCRLTSHAGDVPKTLDSAACKAAPTIDGVIHDCRVAVQATVHAFELSMVRIDPPATRVALLRAASDEFRQCALRRVARSGRDDRQLPCRRSCSMRPSWDSAQGEQVRARDDRKLIAQAIYRDKHVAAPGKGDDDDPHQDGRGAMTRDKGVCSFEMGDSARLRRSMTTCRTSRRVVPFQPRLFRCISASPHENPDGWNPWRSTRSCRRLGHASARFQREAMTAERRSRVRRGFGPLVTDARDCIGSRLRVYRRDA